EVEVLQLHRKLAEHGWDGQPAHAVTGVHRDFQRTDVHWDQGEQVGRVAVEDVLFGRRPRLAVVGRNASDELLDDALQARALADRLSTSAAELDAVVLGRIVGGGEQGTRRLRLASRRRS